MRQLVSVLTDTGVSYFTADENGDAQQVAQLINPGFAVPDVVELGLQLTDVLRLNGHSTTGRQVKALPGRTTTAKASLEAPAAKRRKAAAAPVKAAPVKAAGKPRRAYQTRGTSLTTTREYLRTHPQARVAEIARALIGTDDKSTRAAISAQLGVLWKRGELIREQDPDWRTNGNHRTQLYSLVIQD